MISSTTPTATRQVQMLDLKAEFALFEPAVRAAIDDVLESQQFIGGPAIAKFEEDTRRRLGIAHAIAISSGTDAILCALMALGLGPGDEVILPSFTFFATAGCVARVGAKPVFVDIDPHTFNLSPAAVDAAVTPRTKAIMPVHLYGQCAEMDELKQIAFRHGLSIIEDAAQAIGARYKDRPAGALGDIACLSFYPTKNLGGFGEGGMILTQRDDLAAICRQLRTHGESTRYHHDLIGGNFRLDTLKAAVLSVKLEHWPAFTLRRRAIAAQYDSLLSPRVVAAPKTPPHQYHVYHQYTIRADRRDDLKNHLQKHGVASAIYYPVPLHLQKCFEPLGYRKGMLPVTEHACANVLSLPCQPMLDDDEIRYVADCVNNFSPPA